MPADWSSTWREHISGNYLIVSVVRESSLVETNSQKAALGLVDILASIGGQSGLWIGISFLSLIEVMEVLYRLIQHQFCRLRDQYRNKKEMN